jgi:hypothetical protein
MEYWSIGVLEYCANLESRPASAGLGVLLGNFNGTTWLVFLLPIVVITGYRSGCGLVLPFFWRKAKSQPSLAWVTKFSYSQL